MKKVFVIFFAILLIACKKDDDKDFIILNYDGVNVTAPTLPPGFYEFSIKLTSLLTRNAAGKSIFEVSYYLYEAPNQGVITISADNNGLPGDIIYQQPITTFIRNSWNDVIIDRPFELDGSIIWVGIQITQNEVRQTVGCDAGPANPNGDWLYDQTDQTWRTFRQRVGDSINWNIRVKAR